MSKRKIIALLMTIVLLFTMLSVPAYAEEPTPELTESDLFITEEVAEYLATFFVDDMIATGQTIWTDETEIVEAVTMYDEAGEVTAYTFELTTGYVVVAAYLDMPDIITEWADEAEPVYEEFNLEEDTEIVYVGVLDYYLDEGEETLETVEGVEVPREYLENSFEEMRDIENVEDEVIEEIVEMKASVPKFPEGIMTFDNQVGQIITDPFIYARNVYGGSWVANNYSNYWESFTNFAMMAAYPGYVNHCGPVAITNLIKMYGKRYNVSNIKNASDQAVFSKVIETNNDNHNMFYGSYNGTLGMDVSIADMFAINAFWKYYVSIRTFGKGSGVPYDVDYQNTVNALGSTPADRLMFMMLSPRYTNPYGAHAVVGYAYTRLRCTTATDMYRAFIKIVDGWNSSGRYVEIDSIPNGRYWEINFD